VIAHGRFSGFGESVDWIVAETLRIEDGVLVEHWDVIQDEATKEQSKSGNPMFGDSFPIYHEHFTTNYGMPDAKTLLLNVLCRNTRRRESGFLFRERWE
jgi:hypothetical protein